MAAKKYLYDYSLLQHIGHERPMSREGFPIGLADKKRREIQRKLSKFPKPQSWMLKLIKVS